MAKKKSKKESKLIETLVNMSEEEEIEEEFEEEIEEEFEEEPEEDLEEEEPEEDPEEDISFISFIEKINEALRSKEGKKLNCRVKVVVSGKEAYIYQGLKHNTWARIFKDKKHIIYRYTLRRLLTTHPATKKLFTPDKIRV